MFNRRIHPGPPASPLYCVCRRRRSCRVGFCVAARARGRRACAPRGVAPPRRSPPGRIPPSVRVRPRPPAAYPRSSPCSANTENNASIRVDACRITLKTTHASTCSPLEKWRTRTRRHGTFSHGQPCVETEVRLCSGAGGCPCFASGGQNSGDSKQGAPPCGLRFQCQHINLLARRTCDDEGDLCSSYRSHNAAWAFKQSISSPVRCHPSLN